MDAAALQRHEFNRGFDWQPIRGPLRRLTRAQADSYDEHGYCIVENAIEADELARLVAEIDPFEEKTEAFLATQVDGRAFINRAGEITLSLIHI